MNPTADLKVLIDAAISARNKLASLGRIFNSNGFTDRYGDGPDCVGRVELLDTALAPFQGPTISNGLHIADVYHAGSDSYYTAVLLKKLTPEEALYSATLAAVQ